jgi:hypothetical protein
LAAASGGPTITTGSTDFLAPDGASGSITKYVGGAASGAVQNAFYTGFTPTISAAGAYTFSLFVKAGATNPLNFCALQFTSYTGGSGTSTSYFSLASGTALTSGASIQNYGNGWYRLISPPYTIAAGDLNGNVVFNLAEGNSDLSWNTSGALNLTAYAWGAQIEAGSVATSYIPTTTAAVTRNADVVTLSGAVSGCIGQTEGTVYAEVDLRSPTNAGAIIQLDSGDSTNRIFLGAGATINIGCISGGSSYTLPVTGSYLTGVNKIAVVYGSSNFTAYLNGVQIGSATPTAGTFPTNLLTQFNIGSRISAGVRGAFLNDRIRSAALYTTRLTNAELAALTTL